MIITFEKNENGFIDVFKKEHGVKTQLDGVAFQDVLFKLYGRVFKKQKVKVKSLHDFYYYYNCISNRECFENNFEALINGSKPTDPILYDPVKFLGRKRVYHIGVGGKKIEIV